ncbi:hypothetical protein EK21DRAFT_17890, partial [Setomelanomma holmii]
KYSYAPLEKTRQEIRLLHLLPRAQATADAEAPCVADDGIVSRTQDEICCELNAVSLDETPSYEALSYVWGDPTTTHHVVLDGLKFPVTANLHTALAHLRLRSTTRTIWIE